MPKTQEIAEQRARVELKRQRREQGLCIECGKGEPVGNTGGDFVLRCQPCLEVYRANRKPKSEHVTSRFVKPPERPYDPDYCWLDDPIRHQFIADVKSVLTYERAMTKGEIVRTVAEMYGLDFVQRNINDALSNLVGSLEVIEKGVCLTSFQLTVPRQEPVKRYNGQIIPPRSVQPDNASIYSERV